MNFLPDLSDYPSWAKIALVIALIFMVCVLVFARNKKEPSSRPSITVISNISKDLSGVPVHRLEAEKAYRIEFTLKNGGNALARAVTIKSNWAAVPTALPFPIPPPYASVDHPGEVSMVTLGIGETVLHPSLLQPQSAHNFQGIETGALKLFLFGEISYSDLSNREYTTTFCARYQVQTGDWAFGGAYNDAR